MTVHEIEPDLRALEELKAIGREELPDVICLWIFKGIPVNDGEVILAEVGDEEGVTAKSGGEAPL